MIMRQRRDPVGLFGCTVMECEMFAKHPGHSVQDRIMYVLVSRGYSPDNGDAECNSFLNMNAFTWQLDFLCKSDGIITFVRVTGKLGGALRTLFCC